MTTGKIESIHKLFLKNRGISIDSRTVKKGDLFFALKGPNFDGNQYALMALDSGAMAAIVDDPKLDGVRTGDSRFILVPDALSILQELASFHRNQSVAKIIGITGSNGKTTTKELLASVLELQYDIICTKGNLNNHIGVPLTLLKIKEDTEIAIVEMGANHIGEIAELCALAIPDYGLITNIGKAHIEGFGSLEGIKKGKGELYRAIKDTGGRIFVNASDHTLVELANDYSTISYYSQESSFGDTRITSLEVDGNLEIGFLWNSIQIKERTNLYGAYNIPNILAALNIGYYFQISPPEALKAIAAYVPQNSRSQRLQTGSNEIYLDAYNANPSSMESALRAFSNVKSNNKLVILGDMFELGDESKDQHQSITDLAEELFENVILVGENFQKVSSGTAKYQRTSDLKHFLCNEKLQNHTILLKGSRGMALEKLLDEL